MTAAQTRSARQGEEVMELLSCPFCGSSDKLKFSECPAPWWIECEECFGEGPSAETKAEAIAAWNTRSPSHGEEIVERVARAMRAELERQAVPMSEPSDSDVIRHMVVIYHSPAVSLEHLARSALAKIEGVRS